MPIRPDGDSRSRPSSHGSWAWPTYRCWRSPVLRSHHPPHWPRDGAPSAPWALSCSRAMPFVACARAWESLPPSSVRTHARLRPEEGSFGSPYRAYSNLAMPRVFAARFFQPTPWATSQPCSWSVCAMAAWATFACAPEYKPIAIQQQGLRCCSRRTPCLQARRLHSFTKAAPSRTSNDRRRPGGSGCVAPDNLGDAAHLFFNLRLADIFHCSGARHLNLELRGNLDDGLAGTADAQHRTIARKLGGLV